MHVIPGQRRRIPFVAASVLALLVSLPSFAADISYVYDDAGRLRAVIDPASDTAVYGYDAVGNLTGITRQPSSTLAVLQFTPGSSPIGTTVTIYGTGFSATPASNTLKFNGVNSDGPHGVYDGVNGERPEWRHHRAHQCDHGSEPGKQFCSIYCRHRRGSDTGDVHPCRWELWRDRDPDWYELRHDPDQQSCGLHWCDGRGGDRDGDDHHGAGACYRANRADLGLDRQRPGHQWVRVLCRPTGCRGSRCAVHRAYHGRWSDGHCLDSHGQQEWPDGLQWDCWATRQCGFQCGDGHPVFGERLSTGWRLHAPHRPHLQH